MSEDVARRGPSKHQALEQRIARQPIGAMQSGERCFADRVEMIDVGPSADVAHHAAASVMRRRNDRDRLLCHVDAEFEALRVDRRKVLANEGSRLVRNVEIHAIETAFLDLEIDRAGDDVARRELGTRIVLGHEARPVGQLQEPAFAAHCFADQERLRERMVKACRMELDELHVRRAASGAP